VEKKREKLAGTETRILAAMAATKRTLGLAETRKKEECAFECSWTRRGKEGIKKETEKDKTIIEITERKEKEKEIKRTTERQRNKNRQMQTDNRYIDRNRVS
jgi:hypothetical protein